MFKEHKHHLDLLAGPMDGLLAAVPSLNIIDSTFYNEIDYFCMNEKLCRQPDGWVSL